MAVMSNSFNFQREKSFSHFLMSQCLNLRRWALTVGLFLYIIFAVMDVVKFPQEVYVITLTARLLLVILPLIFLTYSYWVKPPKSIHKYVYLMLLVYLGGGLNHILIYYLSELHGLPFSTLGLVLILMFGCLLTALPILHAGITSLIVLAVYSVVNFYFANQLIDLLFILTILSCVAGMCLAINLVCQKVLYQNYQLINRLYQDSISDGLTKLKNKRFFLEQIEFVTELVKREKASIGLIFIDADHFKAINDSFGHDVGDEVLVEFANVITSKFRRKTDMGFRIGGDEFSMILYNVTKQKLEQMCEELVAEIANLNIKVNDTDVVTSVSVGAVFMVNLVNYKSENLVKLADESLYRAKNNGKNQFFLNAFEHT